jgi:nicotinamidase-related amidase
MTPEPEGRISAMCENQTNRTALLVIDLQRYFLDVGHEEKLARVGTLIAKTNELIDLFHAQDVPVVKIQIVHKADGSTWNQGMKPHWTGQPIKGTLTEGTREAEQHPGVHTHPSDIVVTKTRGSAFIRTELETILTGLRVDTVVLTGFSTNRCVGLTAIDAWERDFKVILAGDAILGTDLANGELMLNYLRNAFGIKTLSNEEIQKLVAVGQGE